MLVNFISIGGNVMHQLVIGGNYDGLDMLTFAARITGNFHS